MYDDFEDRADEEYDRDQDDYFWDVCPLDWDGDDEYESENEDER